MKNISPGRKNNQRPLMGKRIIVTRASKQAGTLSRKLISLGAGVLEVPSIEIRALDPEPIKRAVGNLNNYDLVIFTSVNAVEEFFSLFAGDAGLISRIGKTAAIGMATAKSLEEFNLVPDIVPDHYTAEGLVEKLMETEFETEGARVLLPRAKAARRVLNKALESVGAVVHDIAIYETVPVDFSDDVELMRKLNTGFDLVSFTSPSTADSFTRSLDAGALKRIQDETPAACIGPVTAEAAGKLGYKVVVVPEEHTIDGLVRGIVEFYLERELSNDTR